MPARVREQRFHGRTAERVGTMILCYGPSEIIDKETERMLGRDYATEGCAASDVKEKTIMAELSNELIAKLKKAQSLDEVTELLKADGQEVAQAEKIWKELEDLHESEDKELSLDELEGVAGGVKHRDWLEKGCAATVEPGSNCWGTDGGCSVINIKYSNSPYDKQCPYCGAKYVAYKNNDNGFYHFLCRVCGAYFYFDDRWVRLN